MVKSETCANCGSTIGALETPHLWAEHVVCGACHRKLKDSAGPTVDDLTDDPPPLAESRPSPIPLAWRKGSAARAEYSDRLRWPRLVFLLLALLFSVLPAINAQSGGRPDFTFAWILWGAWILLGLASIIMKAQWKERNGL